MHMRMLNCIPDALAKFRSAKKLAARLNGRLPMADLVTDPDSSAAKEIYANIVDTFAGSEKVVPFDCMQRAMAHNDVPLPEARTHYAFLALRDPQNAKVLAATAFYVVASPEDTPYIGEVYTLTSKGARGWGLLNVLLVAREASAQTFVSAVTRPANGNKKELVTFNDINWPFNMTPGEYKQDWDATGISPAERAQVWYKKGYRRIDVKYVEPLEADNFGKEYAININGYSGNSVPASLMTSFFRHHYFFNGVTKEFPGKDHPVISRMIEGRRSVPVLDSRAEIEKMTLHMNALVKNMPHFALERTKQTLGAILRDGAKKSVRPSKMPDRLLDERLELTFVV